MNDIRTPAVHQPARGDRDEERDDKPVKPKRTTERGPVGFGAVLRDVKGARQGSRRDGGGTISVALGAGGSSTKPGGCERFSSTGPLGPARSRVSTPAPSATRSGGGCESAARSPRPSRTGGDSARSVVQLAIQ